MSSKACTVMAIRQCSSSGALRRAITIAFIVGPILTLINQWEAVWGSAELNWIKVCLSIAVPFTVSMCSCLLMMRKLNEEQS